MMVSDAFANVLRSGRDEFNARFTLARRQYPTLEGAAFAEFLSECADPVVRAVNAAAPARVAEVGMAAYDVGLELVAQRLAGAGAKSTAIAEGWKRILPDAAQAVASAPRRVLGAVSNAVHQLTTFPDTRPVDWIGEMQRLGQYTEDAMGLLKLGQVLAWRAGLAHFRSGALDVADTLPARLAIAAISAASPPPEEEADALWQELRTQVRADRWFRPEKPATGLRVVGRAGKFQGFGGVFTEPPRVAASGDDFVVQSGDRFWLLTADAFGATFHRATSDEFAAALQQQSKPDGVHIDEHILEAKGERLPLLLRGEVTSTAANASTLAITETLSHAIVFVALPR